MATIAEARERRLREWREWSARRSPRRRRTPATTTESTEPRIRSDAHCIDTVAHIATICGRAGLPNAERWLTACADYWQRRTR